MKCVCVDSVIEVEPRPNHCYAQHTLKPYVSMWFAVYYNEHNELVGEGIGNTMHDACVSAMKKLEEWK